MGQGVEKCSWRPAAGLVGRPGEEVGGGVNPPRRVVGKKELLNHLSPKGLVGFEKLILHGILIQKWAPWSAVPRPPSLVPPMIRTWFPQ